MNLSDQYNKCVENILNDMSNQNIHDLNYFIQSNREKILDILDKKEQLEKTINLSNILLSKNYYSLLVIFLELICVKLFKDYNLRYKLASAFYEIKLYHQAEHHLSIIPKGKLNINHYRLYANIYYSSEEFLKCINVIKVIRKIDKVDIINTLLVIDCYRRLKKLDNFERELHNLYKFDLSDHKKFHIKLQTYLVKNLFDEALKEAELYINKYIKHYEIIEIYSLILRKFKKYDEAIKYLETIKENKNIDFLGQIYSLYLGKGMYSKGFDLLSIASDIQAIKSFFETKNVSSWDGQSLDNTCLYVYSGKGIAIGDNIFYFRYLIDLQTKYIGLKIFFCLNKMNLKYLFAHDKIEVIDLNLLNKYISSNNINFFSTLPNVAKIYCKQKDNNIPNFKTFLPSSKSKINLWSDYLKNFKSKLKIGLNWKGNIKYKYDIYRSLEIKELKAIFGIPDSYFFLLNPNVNDEERVFIKDSKNIILIDKNLMSDETHNAYSDTLEIMRCLDLIITTDTSTAHISAALGLRTYLMLEYGPSWYWNTKDKENYYQNKNLNFINQSRPGDWESVIYNIRNRILDMSIYK